MASGLLRRQQSTQRGVTSCFASCSPRTAALLRWHVDSDLDRKVLAVANRITMVLQPRRRQAERSSSSAELIQHAVPIMRSGAPQLVLLNIMQHKLRLLGATHSLVCHSVQVRHVVWCATVY